jgi:3-phenylpropionate/trans-cinnamate dioxygenase ferredoxin reductase component
MPVPGLIVIGSGPAGVAAAEAFRDGDPDTPILLISADQDPPYARPPLSKDYLRGDTDDVALHEPSWYADRSIQLSLGRRVDAIDPDAHRVMIEGVPREYTALVLATGSAPSPLPVPGGEHALSLRSLADARRLRQSAMSAKSAVVIGSGFIGCEAAASLAMQDIPVTVIAPERLPQEKRLGAAAGDRLRQLVEQAGARHAGGASVQGIERRDDRLVVSVSDGITIDCELVLAATGVHPQAGLATAAGLKVDDDGRIVVDADARSSAPDVYAAGDVALMGNDAAGRHIAVEHWQDAEDQGAIAGTNAAGGQQRWADVPGFWSTIGDATIKYHAWGDGYDAERLVERHDGFAVWYVRGGVAVGVLTCNSDDDYDEGEALIRVGKPPPLAIS